MTIAGPAVIEDARLLRCTGEFLKRIAADPSFAENFDKDPAGALQEFLPELKFLPKARIEAELTMAGETLLNSSARDISAVYGFWRVLARAGMKLVTNAIVRQLSVYGEPSPE